ALANRAFVVGGDRTSRSTPLANAARQLPETLGSAAIGSPFRRVAFVGVYIIDLHDRRVGSPIDGPARTKCEIDQHHQRFRQFDRSRHAPSLTTVQVEGDPVRFYVDAVGMKLAIQ